MSPQQTKTNAVAAIRVSTTRQGTDGDSPEAQKEQIERYAAARGITIQKFFVFLESASKEQQPIQEAINFCKNPGNNVQLFIIKSIDRFTRGGSYSYDHLKMQLDRCKVSLVDIYGIISAEKVNTLDHLGFEYNWSLYSPSKKSEILEAERAKDEMRDIMSRMIGAEIRYTQMGYWMRQPPLGFKSEKIETKNGKRCVLKPHATEAALMVRMYELKAQGTLDDHQIAEELNSLGFQTRIQYVRSKTDRTKVVGQKGGKKLTAKKLNYYIQNPIYAGVIKEKWTQDKPVKACFDGLISFELFNKANRGKLALIECADGDIELQRKQPPQHLVKKGVKNAEFPYKRFVMCPECEKPLLGSASRGKLGKYYPAYHCSNHGHYFRVPKQEFEETITAFVKNIVIDPDRLEALTDAVVAVWDQKQLAAQKDEQALDARITELQSQTRILIDKMKMLSSPTAIKHMEDDLVKTEDEIAKLEAAKEDKQTDEKAVDIRVITAYVKYFMEHLDELLIHLSNPVNKAAYFSVLFDKAPTYQEIKDGTQKIAQSPEVNELLSVLYIGNSDMVTPRRIELRLPG